MVTDKIKVAVRVRPFSKRGKFLRYIQISIGIFDYLTTLSRLHSKTGQRTERILIFSRYLTCE